MKKHVLQILKNWEETGLPAFGRNTWMALLFMFDIKENLSSVYIVGLT